MDNKKNYKTFLKKVNEHKVFLINHYESVVVRSVPGKGYFVKFKEAKEVFIQKGNSSILELIVDYREITEEEYNKF